jgi:hypothetical protein
MGRRRVEVDEQVLRQTVKTVEADQSFDKLSALFEAVAAAYNAQMNTTIKPGTIGLRVKEWSIDTVTQPARKVGRKPSSISKEDLETAIRTAESEDIIGKTNFFIRVGELAGTSNTTAAKLADEYGIEYDVVAGKRGGKGRKRKHIEKEALEKVIRKVEKQDIVGKTAFLTEVGNAFDVSFSTIANFIKEYGITFTVKAGKRGGGKRAIEVNREALEAAVEKAEKHGPLKNLSVLHQKVAEIYNQDNDEISPAVVGLRIADWDLDIKTQKGRRGRAPSNGVQVVKKRSKKQGLEQEDSPLANLIRGRFISVYWPERGGHRVVKIHRIKTDEKGISKEMDAIFCEGNHPEDDCWHHQDDLGNNRAEPVPHRVFMQGTVYFMVDGKEVGKPLQDCIDEARK